ncbi:MAG: hypothetical protein K2W82_12665 [Candidatus Obscuribacterales bacterium]|nr:hypothetical protein [Candidatus Obscuribacterales bacterium]
MIKLTPLKVICIAAIVAPALYVFSIVWRVSCAEQDLFGRSCLVPFSLRPRSYNKAPVSESYGDGTFVFNRNGQQIFVYKQLINGFQHTYGSALVAHELGRKPAELLFALNEYVEAYLCRDGFTKYHFIDTKKDLANNKIGRQIGYETRRERLLGTKANKHIIDTVLIAMNNGTVINHYLNSRVQSLPSPDQCGCLGLPHP